MLFLFLSRTCETWSSRVRDKVPDSYQEQKNGPQKSLPPYKDVRAPCATAEQTRWAAPSRVGRAAGAPPWPPPAAGQPADGSPASTTAP